jgi:hypothetical protein
MVCCAVSAGCGGGGSNSNMVANAAVSSKGTNTGSAATTNSGGGYPQETVDAFLKSCETAGSDKAFCGCVLDKLQARYTHEEFQVIEDEIQAGEPSSEFVEFSENARAECEKSGSANGNTKS